MDSGRFAEITDYSWSPDSKSIAYDKQNTSTFSAVYLYSLETKQSTAITGELVNSQSPIWDPEGKYLYFLSDRDYNEVIGAFDFEFTNPKTTRVYLLTLRADLPSPLPALSDETEVKREAPAPVSAAPDQEKAQAKAGSTAAKSNPETAKKDEANSTAANDALKNFRIDLDGIQNRLVALPVPPASITAIDAARGSSTTRRSPYRGSPGRFQAKTLSCTPST